MRTRIVASFLTLALSSTLAAQQPAAVPDNPITVSFRTRILASHRNIAQAFDSIPASLFAYKPTPAQQTIGYIAQHLVNDNYLFCDAFGESKAVRQAEDTATPDSVKATWPKDKLMPLLKASFDFCAAAFAQLTDASLDDQVELTFGANTRTVTRANMVLGHALDLADHYSQLANYMRLNNIIPPTALPRPRP